MWIITGGCGFIGSNFIHYLLREYEDISILNLDKLTYAGNLMNLKSVEGDKRYSFVKGDIADYSTLNNVFSKDVELVVNFAAESHVDKSIESGDEFIHTNVSGTHALLKYCLKYECDFVQISTDEVYGSINEGYFKEDDKFNPSSIYSSSKAAAELLVNSYNCTYQLGAKITRSSNNFGPYQFPEKLIPLFITNLLRNKKLPVYGKGDNIRDWIYVEDNCRAIDTVINKGEKGGIYNIGGGNEKRNIEITELMLSELQHGDDMIEYVEDRKGHDFRYAIDSSKIKDLGWEPKLNFEEAFKTTIQWYKENQEWWAPLLKK